MGQMSDEEFERHIQKEFVIEASELMGRFEEILLGIQAEPFPETQLNDLFRVAHTIKGSALAVKFAFLGGFVHKVEGLLDTLRKNKCEVSETTVDLLLKANDLSREILTAASKGTEFAPDISGFLSEIEQTTQALLGHEPAQPIKSASPAQPLIQHTPTHVAPSRTGSYDHLRPMRILICDDEEEIRSILSEGLSDQNWEISEAGSGTEALQVMADSSFDLLITDYTMPQMNGELLIEAVRKRDQRMAILMSSAYASQELLLRLINLRLDGFIGKPFSLPEVTEKVRICLNLKRSRDAIVSLSSCNFRAYMTVAKIINHQPTDPRTSSLQSELETHLDEIASLTKIALQI